jgi:hypothetical protein
MDSPSATRINEPFYHLRGDLNDHCQNNPERISGKAAGSHTDTAFAD